MQIGKRRLNWIKSMSQISNLKSQVSGLKLQVNTRNINNAGLIPGVLKLVQVFWWIILTIVFYLILTPIGLILRLFKSDFLEQRFSSAKTYWKAKENRPFNPRDYERQF